MSSKDLVHRTFKNHFIIMKIFGLYPFDHFPKLYKPYAFIFYAIFTVLTPTLAIAHIIFSGEHSIEAISQDGFMILQLGILIIKLIPCKFNPEGTKRIIHAMNQNIFNRHSLEQEPILKETVDNCRLVFQLYGSSCIFALLIWASTPLMDEARRFPLPIWLPFDPFENTAVYVLIYTLLISCVVSASASNTTVDTVVSFQVYHAASQIRILKDILMNLGERTEVQVSNDGKPKSNEEKEQLKAHLIYMKIAHCVDHYDAIYDLVADLEKTFTFVLFSQMIASIIVICICCLYFSVVVPFTVPFFGTVAFAVAMLIQLSLYCYPGTLLYEESSSVITAIYMSEWYTYDEKSKKALLTLMERAKRPIKVTAGKLLDLSLATFATIIRRSYSLLAVLKNY